MDNELRKICEDFIENRDILRDKFGREGMAIHSMGAAIMSSLEERPDAERLEECKKLLRKLEGIFSPFRGALKLPVIIYMAASEDPEAYLKAVRSAYDYICTEKGSRNERNYLPAMRLAFEAGSEDEMNNLISGDEASRDDAGDFNKLIHSLGMEEDEITAEIKSAEEFLSIQKGFGRLGTSSEMRKMYAEMLVCMAHGKRTEAASLAAGLALDDALISRFRA